MSEYHKIQTVWLRDPATNHKTLLEGQWALPEFEYLQGVPWEWTEKVDGTNIRVMWNDKSICFGGKTDQAQLYVPLYDRLVELFNPENMEAVFGGEPAVLYGEGFGAKIQKSGGNYLSDRVDFTLFDVRIGDLWLTQESVRDIAIKIGCDSVPLIGVGTLGEAIEHVRSGFPSTWGPFAAEGLVMRPHVDLLSRRGERIITKIKHRDFAR